MIVWLKASASRALFQIERFRFMFSQSTDRKFILIGEKEGWQARDNAYHLFRYLHDSGRRDVFFVTRKRNEDLGSLVRFGDSLVTYNSRRHYYMLLRSKLLILNDGYSDACPRLPGILNTTHEPFYYLRHGILRYKKIYFSSGHYNGRIVRFGASTRTEVEIVRNRMMPRSVERELTTIQAYLYLMGSDLDPFDLRNFPKIDAMLRAHAGNPAAPRKAVAWIQTNIDRLAKLGDQIGFPSARLAPHGLPRHDSLLAKMDAGAGVRNMIVVFLTWRDYWLQRGSDDQLRAQPLYLVVREIVDNPLMTEFLEAHDLTIGIYIHQKMSAYRSVLSEGLHPRVRVIDDTMDLQEMIVRSAALVTDYSSVSLDFCLVGRPVFFYQFDQDRYNEGRGDYTDADNEWVGRVVTDLASLIN